MSDTQSEAPAATLGQQIDLVTGFLRRRYKLILACLILALPFGGLYLYVTPASYTCVLDDADRDAAEPLATDDVAGSGS